MDDGICVKVWMGFKGTAGKLSNIRKSDLLEKGKATPFVDLLSTRQPHSNCQITTWKKGPLSNSIADRAKRLKLGGILYFAPVHVRHDRFAKKVSQGIGLKQVLTF
jgi:hypothetical protein